MLFNSINFAFFLPVVFAMYWLFRKNLKIQNILLLISSYFFYACWDYRFLFLLIFSTLLDYYTAIKITQAQKKRSKKLWFWLSLTVNIGFLGFFKYYNFFAESFAKSLSHFGLNENVWTLNIILPIGISFYTFHGVSYIIDIYNEKIKPEKNFIDYSLFVSFFPLLVAGPIERATHLLPQIKKERKFDYCQSVDGLKQILWGLFKKVVLADNCAIYANSIFGNYLHYSGSTLVLGALFFSIQIYCDFSGYSDIALGVARLFGIDLLRNFAFPYFSRDIAEFWRRWHISLSSWFKDYLYIPLGGSKGNTWQTVKNVLIIFLVSGFWHGANWTFIIWGLLNAIYIIPSVLLKRNRYNIEIVAKGKMLPSLKDLFSILTTFCLTTLAWIFFRSATVSSAIAYIQKVFSKSLFTFPYFPGITLAISTTILIIFFFVLEWLGREDQYAIANILKKRPRIIRFGLYYLIILIIVIFMGKKQEFIYFQF